MISDITTEIFGKSGGSHHTNVFGVEIELLLLDSMVFMLPFKLRSYPIFENFPGD